VPLERVFQSVVPCTVMERAGDLRHVQDFLSESLAKRKSAIAVIASDVFGMTAPTDLPPAPQQKRNKEIEMIDERLAKWLTTVIPKSKKPLIFIGRGVTRLPNLRSAMCEFMKEHPHIPCVVSLQGLRFPSEGLKGIVGIMGEGRANRLVYECDHLIILDERLGIECTGAVHEFLANKRVSSIEVSSEPQNAFTPHFSFRISEQAFIQFLDKLGIELHATEDSAWAQDISALQTPMSFPETCLRELFARCDIGEYAICLDSGQNFFWAARSLGGTKKILPIYSYHQATMGFALPAAVGASCAKEEGGVLAVCGDGGFLMHCAELETITHYNLSVKVVVLDNQGLGMVRQTQLAKHMNPLSVDLRVERFECLAQAFGLPFFEIRDEKNARYTIERFLDSPGAALLQIHIDPALQLGSRGNAFSPLPL